MTAEVIKFPKPGQPSLIVERYDGKEATVKVKYEHVVNAMSLYLQTMPFGIDNKYDILDVDLGVPVDKDGYVTMDIVFDRE